MNTVFASAVVVEPQGETFRADRRARPCLRSSHIGLIAAALAFFVLWCPSGASPQVLINEIVADPQQDWNDSDGGDSIAFNDLPGTGPVTTSDEWVELLNTSGSTLDLTSWTLAMVDTSSATEVLGAGQAILVFSAGSTLDQFLPGARLVVGNTTGSINNNCALVLANALGQTVDEVELGTGDFAGDGVANNAPSGDARALWDEAVARVPDGYVTGNPALDFRHVRATIGNTNPSPTTPAVLRINEVVTDPQHDWNDSDGGNGVPFDDQPGSGTISTTDEWVELVNVSTYAGSILYWSLVMHDTTPATETLGAANAVFVFELGGSLDNVLPGEHVVIGNPAGSMNNDVWIRVLDDRGEVVDEVELGDQDFRGNGPGDEAPDGNATNALDEAVARFPDAADTGDGAADFCKRPATIGRANRPTRALFWQLYP